MRRLTPSRPADLLSPPAGPPAGLVRLPTGAGASSSERLLERFQATAPARFFAGAADVATPAQFARLAPAARDATVARAESILMGRFDLLGHRGLSFGDPVDWHLDPVSGRRSPLVHWSLLDPTDAARLGDCKVVWELSRQQFLVTLGIAYRSTGDERYAQGFAALVRAWQRANPPGLGLNWASSLEAALRIVSWCWALVLLGRSPQLTPDLFADLLAGIGVHATHVERYLSRHSSPNTHLTGEALGLFYAGLLTEGRSAARWRALGQRVLEEQVHLQVLPDGVYFEQSTGYQRYTVETYLHYLVLAERNGLPVSAAVRQGLQRMLDVLLALRRPDGGLPAIGDADGGCLLPVVPRSPDDTRGLFALAAGCLARADYRWAAEGPQPEALWFLGPGAVAADEPAATAPPAEVSRAFTQGGYVVMRSGWQHDAHHLVFDVGPLGCPMTGAHGHADLLSVQVSPFGEACIVDPGTYGYCADPAFREHFRGTSAHATVVVDGQGQAEPRGPFSWSQRPRARLHGFLSTPGFDLADASHDAYQRLPDPVVHRRRVAFVKSPACWLIVDDLAGAGEHRVELGFQFAPQSVSETAQGWVRAVSASGRGLLVRAFGREALALRIEAGALDPIAGWVSPNYGQRLPAPALVYSAVARLPLRVLTLLLPVEDGLAAPPDVQPLLDEQGAPLGLRFADGGLSIRFGADTLALERPPTCTA